QWRGLAVDRIRQGEYMAARSHKVIRKTAVGIPPQKSAVGTQAGLACAAIEAHAAANSRVDNDAVTYADAIATSLDDFADHLVPHDQRMTNGNDAFKNLQVGAADAAIGHPDQDLVAVRLGPFDFSDPQITRGPENHCFHKKNYSSDGRLDVFYRLGDVARKSCADNIAEFRFRQQPLMAQRKILDGGDHPHGLFLGERNAEISQSSLHGIDPASLAHHDASRRLANHVPVE